MYAGILHVDSKISKPIKFATLRLILNSTSKKNNFLGIWAKKLFGNTDFILYLHVYDF